MLNERMAELVAAYFGFEGAEKLLLDHNLSDVVEMVLHGERPTQPVEMGEEES